MKRRLGIGFFVVMALGLGFSAQRGVGAAAGQGANPAVAIDRNDIGGVVTGPRGPEAGVWVIAEAGNLATRMAKIVVTDDQGRARPPRICPTRPTRCGYAATGWSTPPRSPPPSAAGSTSARSRPPTQPPRPRTTPPPGGHRCSRHRPRTPSRSGTSRPRPSGSA